MMSIAEHIATAWYFHGWKKLIDVAAERQPLDVSAEVAAGAFIVSERDDCPFSMETKSI
jgi:hypothetical protein